MYACLVSGGQKRALDSLELELEFCAIMWVLGTEAVSSARVFSALNC